MLRPMFSVHGAVILLTFLLSPTAAQEEEAGPETCPPRLDVAFVLDTSGSIEQVYAEHVKWTLELADLLPLRHDAVRLAVIQYAGYPLTEFSLSTYSSVDHVRKHIQQITFQSGVTRTGYALRKAESELFREEKGARAGADKLVILFSDGLSIDDPLRIADSLRLERNVTIFVVSVGSDGFVAEMERIAGSHDNTFGPHDLERLKAETVRRVEDARICAGGRRLRDIAITKAAAATTSKAIATTTTAPPLPPSSTAPYTTTTERTTHILASFGRGSASVSVFDNAGPGGGRPSFSAIRSFFESAQQTVTGQPILLRKESTPEESAEVVEDVAPRFHVFTPRSAATTKRTTTFQSTTTKASTTTRTTTPATTREPTTRATAKPWKNPAAEKHKKGRIVEVTAPPTTTSQTTTPTTKTEKTTRHPPATRPHLTTRQYSLPLKKSSAAKEEHTERAARAFAVRNQPFVEKEESGDCKLDVLLVVDSSGSVQRSYDIQKRFLASVLEEIDVSTRTHRVALIQFAGARLQKTEWSFDDMKANEQLMRAFTRVRHFTGTTYIGAALSAARSLLDTRRAGVKTIVLLLSDGYSQDEVVDAADDISSMEDVEIFAVSVSPLSNVQLLERVTGDVSRVFVGRESELMRDVLKQKLDCTISRA